MPRRHTLRRGIGVWHNRHMRELQYVTDGSLFQFLRNWYGEPGDESIAFPSSAPPMPDLLRKWYYLTSRWSVPICRYNRFFSPERLYECNGKLVFLAENQGACNWGVDLTGDDPFVHESDDVLDKWVPTGFPLSKFLLWVAVSEAVHGNHTLINLDMEKRIYDSVASNFLQLDDPLWRYPNPDWRYMTAEGMLAYGGIDPPSDAPSDHYWIMVSAKHPEALERLPSGVFK